MKGASDPSGEREGERLRVDGGVELRAALLDHEHLLLGDLLGDALEARQELAPLAALPGLPLDVEKERLEVERLVEVVDEQLEVQDPLIQRLRSGAEERVDDRGEHVLAQGALGFLAAADELGVEAGVGVGRLHALAGLGVVHLALAQVRGGKEAEQGHREGREQAAHRLQDDRGLVPDVALRRRRRVTILSGQASLPRERELAGLLPQLEVVAAGLLEHGDRQRRARALVVDRQLALAPGGDLQAVPAELDRWRRTRVVPPQSSLRETPCATGLPPSLTVPWISAADSASGSANRARAAASLFIRVSSARSINGNEHSPHSGSRKRGSRQGVTLSARATPSSQAPGVSGPPEVPRDAEKASFLLVWPLEEDCR